MKISKNWTVSERITIVMALLPGLQDDIYADRYSDPGRPNITSIQILLGGSIDMLESQRANIENFMTPFVGSV